MTGLHLLVTRSNKNYALAVLSQRKDGTRMVGMTVTTLPVTVPSSSPKYVKSQPKVLVVSEGHHVVTSTNIRMSIS